MSSTYQFRRNSTRAATVGHHFSVQDHHTAMPASWHPKLTPYRLIIIVTTIAVGTAKAILAQKQSTEIPITLEWISGTFLSLLFFTVSAYDSREEVPNYLHWLFKPDCMDAIWRLLSLCFSIERPNYTSEEGTAQALQHGRPLITTYRILVSATVASVGMSKAMLGYYGYSSDVTWIDWALGVPLTVLLYCLGLYEYNSSQMWPTFFASDQTPVLYFLSNTALGSLSLSLSAAWVIFWTRSLQIVTYNLEWDMTTPRPVNYKPTIKSFLEDLFDRGLKLFIQECILAAITGGLFACYLIFRHIMAKGGIPRRIFRSARRVLAQAVAKTLPDVGWRNMWIESHISDLSTTPSRPFLLILARLHSAGLIVLHISLHLLCIVVLGTFTMLMLGMSATMFNTTRNTMAGHDIIYRSTLYIVFSFWVFAGLGAILAQVRIATAMLFPFWSWYRYSTPLVKRLFQPL